MGNSCKMTALNVTVALGRPRVAAIGENCRSDQGHDARLGAYNSALLKRQFRLIG